MSDISPILGPSGEALPGVRSRAMSASVTAYQAADPMSQEMAGWWPMSGSADRDILGESRVVTDRIRDLVRNNGWASGAVQREIDSIVGANFRFEPYIDHEALGITFDQAVELGNQFEREWTLWANDPQRYCDVSRHDDWHGLAGLMFRHKRVDGENLAVIQWRPRPGARYATCVQVIDPDRLSNPDGRPDEDRLRGGVEMDDDGAAIAYWIAKGHPRDIGIPSADSWTWERVARETPWGRPIVIHDFDRHRADQHRGLSAFAPMLKNMKMLDRYQAAELSAALLNATLAAFIESPFDHEFLMELLGDQGGEKAFEQYQGKRTDFHTARGVSLGGVKIPALFPGEKIGWFNPTRPSAQMEAFSGAMLRNFAAGMPTHTAETVSLDYSHINYSSARAARIVAGRSITRERITLGVRTGSQVYHGVIEEAVMMGRVKLPKGAPPFHAAREVYLGGDWMGPPEGWIDPVKEAQAAGIRIDGDLSNLRDECAAQGRDWRDNLRQKAVEMRYAASLGLPDPDREKAMAIKPTTDEHREDAPNRSGGNDAN
ncbi:phage portal protein [Magnetospirillum fulvum]|uniref:Phage portal protein, lambda family n=1 Tax=Magnetospirillum fulvum MGU-K5 TaxID=1316936 RepID=S9S655_MAGFU|nr:phage portal protein [Magnetospirillum fulvum]EPY01392.1 phage portal protein, lambda family [Magnetospirillum fulvum MGU-K5]